MPLFIRTIIANWRFRRMMRPYDRQIEKARAKHKAVKPIMAAKSDFLHAALEGRQLQIEVGR